MPYALAVRVRKEIMLYSLHVDYNEQTHYWHDIYAENSQVNTDVFIWVKNSRLGSKTQNKPTNQVNDWIFNMTVLFISDPSREEWT